MYTSLPFVLFGALVLLAPVAAAQCPCDGYQKVQPRIQRQNGKGSREQPLLANRVGQIWVRVQGNQPDSVGLYVDGRLRKSWRISPAEDAASYEANTVAVLLQGRRELLLVNHTTKHYARFPVTDRFRTVGIYLSPHIWWVKKTNQVTVIE